MIFIFRVMIPHYIWVIFNVSLIFSISAIWCTIYYIINQLIRNYHSSRGTEYLEDSVIRVSCDCWLTANSYTCLDSTICCDTWQQLANQRPVSNNPLSRVKTSPPQTLTVMFCDVIFDAEARFQCCDFSIMNSTWRAWNVNQRIMRLNVLSVEILIWGLFRKSGADWGTTSKVDGSKKSQTWFRKHDRYNGEY